MTPAYLARHNPAKSKCVTYLLNEYTTLIARRFTGTLPAADNG